MRKHVSFLSFLMIIVLVLNMFAPSGLATTKLIKDPFLEESIKNMLYMSPEEELTKEDLENLDYLYVSGDFENDAMDLSGLEHAVNLTGLTITYQQIKNLTPLENLTNLNYLEIYNSNLENISLLSKLDKLDTLYLSSNNIKDISPLANLTNLTDLGLSNNEIEDISALSQLKNLQYLYLSDNKITDLNPLSSLKNLQFLDLSNNKVTDLTPLSNLGNLESLYLLNNNITSLKGVPSENLVTLHVYGNQLKSLDGLQVKNDVYYNFDSNNIEDIEALKGIKSGWIYLEDNNIKDISPLKDMEEGIVALRDNNLNSQAEEIIKTLIKRGVEVIHDGTFSVEVRLAGDSRYHTAVSISQQGWKDGTAPTVILARGDAFPDALAGAPLARAFGAPILLTGSKLHGATKDELVRLGAEKVYILGGESAVSKNVEKELKDMGLEVERVAGSGRYETAVEVSKVLDDREVNTAIIAYGKDFPDALSIAPFAAQRGYPILLTETDKLSKATVDYLNKNKNITDIIIVGGEAVIGKNVEKELAKKYKVTRIAGQHRYETAAKIMEKYYGSAEKVYISNGNSFADALSGSVLAAMEEAPLLLVKEDSVPYNTKKATEKIKNFVFLGGENVISNKVKDELLK